MEIKTVLFDMDGTLTDNGLGIKNTLRALFEMSGYEPQPEEVLDQFIGPPLDVSFMKYLGCDQEESVRLRFLYRDLYQTIGLNEVSVYNGIEALLQALSTDGYYLGVASSKSEDSVSHQLKTLGLEKYFIATCGAKKNALGHTKKEVIQKALSEIPDASPVTSVMVGDRDIDLESAHQLGLYGIGVLYGYGSQEELSAAPHLAICETPSQILYTIKL